MMRALKTLEQIGAEMALKSVCESHYDWKDKIALFVNDEVYERIVKSLVKQIPKKILFSSSQSVIYDYMGSAVGEDKREFYECPSCGFKEEIEVWELCSGLRYCPKCGQAIDWSDEE